MVLLVLCQLATDSISLCPDLGEIIFQLCLLRLRLDDGLFQIDLYPFTVADLLAELMFLLSQVLLKQLHVLAQLLNFRTAQLLPLHRLLLLGLEELA